MVTTARWLDRRLAGLPISARWVTMLPEVHAYLHDAEQAVLADDLDATTQHCRALMQWVDAATRPSVQPGGVQETLPGLPREAIR
jgi:hypothetical protein